MAREIEGVRELTQQIVEETGLQWLGLKDVCKFLNKSQHFVKDHIMPETSGLCAFELARRMLIVSRGGKVENKKRIG